MDLQRQAQLFETHIQGYNGEDPLDLWEKYILWAEEALPPQEKRNVSSLLERLVRTFIEDKRYSNDERFLKFCVKFAQYINEPQQFFDYLHNQGVGRLSATIHVAWAQLLESLGDLQNASALYQKAFQSHVEPKDILDHHYRAFQIRISQKNQSGRVASIEPLQNSQILNQMTPAPSNAHPPTPQSSASENRNPVVKPFEAPTCPADPCGGQRVTIISRSAVVPQPSSSAGDSKQVAMYCKEKLVCEDSELSFEEFRANIYRKKYEQRKKMQQWGSEETQYNKIKEEASLHEHLLKQKMEQLSNMLHVEEVIPQMTSVHAPAVQPTPVNANVAPLPDLSGHGVPVLDAKEYQKMDQPQMSKSVLHTPSGLHAPPINQPTPVEPVEHSIHKAVSAEHLPSPVDHSKPNQTVHASSPKSDPEAQHFQDSVSAQPVFIKPTGALDRSSSAFPDVSKQWCPNTSAQGQKLQPGIRDVSGMGSTSGCYANTSHVTPNTSLGLVQATPSKVLPSPTVNTKEALGFIMDIFQTSTLPVNDEEEDHMLDPQDPNEQDFEAFCRNDNNPNTYSKGFLEIENVAPTLPSAFCIFEDDLNKENDKSSKNKPVEVKTFGERPGIRAPLKSKEEVKAAESMVDDCTVWAVRCNKTLAPSPNSTGDFAMAARLASTPSNKQTEQTWQILEDKENSVVENGGRVVFDSSEGTFMQASKIRKLSPIQEQSPEQTKVQVAAAPISSNSVFLTNTNDEVEQTGKQLAACKLSDTLHQTLLVANLDVSLGLTTQPIDICEAESETTAKETEQTVQAIEQVIIEDPWDSKLIARLLSELPTPLNSMSNYHEWNTNVPIFKAKSDLKLGSKLFCKDFLLGEGAFAHVFQATMLDADLMEGQKVTLKVQKPATPWEFYIGTQIRERINPDLRHLYINFHSAHLFLNGSILVGDLYNCGSLLNAVNLHKKKGEKGMPIALAMYIAIIILYMVEKLHEIGIIHGDIKPDNFVLSERFSENQTFHLDFVPYGLALIDLGQSIDMTLLPKGTVFTGKCETSGFQCIEMLTKKPWTYQTDYFGIAGTVYCMLFGNYMKVKNENGCWKTDASFRRYPNGDLWTEFFHTLLNIPDCDSPSPLRALREKLTSIYEMYIKQLKSVPRKLISLVLENKLSRK